jgi:hypothetical protein
LGRADPGLGGDVSGPSPIGLLALANLLLSDAMTYRHANEWVVIEIAGDRVQKKSGNLERR